MTTQPLSSLGDVVSVDSSSSLHTFHKVVVRLKGESLELIAALSVLQGIY